MVPDYDAIIIGTGQAGPSLALRLAGAGMKVAIAERKSIGGTCVNTGCTPTKALVASAYAARIARRAAEFGVAIAGDIGVDMKRVKMRKDAMPSAATTSSPGSTAPKAYRRSSARTCCWRSAAGPTPMISTSTRPGCAATRAAIST
jgi:pyruvate/2-oxoglutarate dehydrogenase complex dihydrolipoamide dehydrogenase (E3) component